MTERSKDDLAIYLRDHYAGAVGAVEMLEHLKETHAEKSLGFFFEELLNDVQADHTTLHLIMAALEIKESVVRDAGAWVAEKVGRGKLGFGGGATSGIQLLQALEILVLGVTGKKLLWRALAGLQDAALPQYDFTKLEQRADQQLARLEAKRLETAAACFSHLP